MEFSSETWFLAACDLLHSRSRRGPPRPRRGYLELAELPWSVPALAGGACIASR